MERLIKPVRRSQAVDEVADQLMRLITNGEAKEGQRLPAEHELATAFDVSRPVVREALRGLRSLGLVVSKPGSGTYVASRTPRPRLLGYGVEELHEVRLLVEVPGAAMAAQRGTEQQFEELRELVGQMADCEDRRIYAELDASFHIALANCSANSLLARLVRDLQELIIENSDLVLLADRARLDRATSEHRDILDAALKRDEVAAGQAMSRHLSGATASLGPPSRATDGSEVTGPHRTNVG